MKSLKSLCYLLMLFVFFAGCNKEEEIKKPTGKLTINVGLFIGVNEVDNQLKSTQGTEDFKVAIFDSNDNEVISFAKASDIPEEIELEIGEYYAIAHSDNNLPAAFENPYYYGRSETVTITPETAKAITINCELANTMVSVIYSDNVKNQYVDYTTTIQSSSGTLIFPKNETRIGYFQPLPLTITVTLNWQESGGVIKSKIITGSISAPLPKKHYEIHINASDVEGSALLQINLNETSVPVEVVELIDGIIEPPSGKLEYGDLIITEIMYDPVALSDATGEWFEIYNTSGHSIDLKNLVIRKNDTESHIVNNSLTLEPYGYYVFARTEEATVAEKKYVYNTDITLNNTGAIISLYDYGTDGTDGILICAVDYGADDFTNATGSSLSLNPESLTVANAILGTFWCNSVTSYNTGDLGTPGNINDACQ